MGAINDANMQGEEQMLEEQRADVGRAKGRCWKSIDAEQTCADIDLEVTNKPETR